MLLGRYNQQPGERLKRILDYVRWLESDEEIQTVTAEVTPETDDPLTVPTIVLDPGGKKFAYYTEGGEDGETYLIQFTVTTPTQVKEDEIEIEVEDVS
jgi:hypothetical protein